VTRRAKSHERLADDRPELGESSRTPLMLTRGAGIGEPRWSPDGDRVSYLCTRNGAWLACMIRWMFSREKNSWTDTVPALTPK
jgi:hypothetical protein